MIEKHNTSPLNHIVHHQFVYYTSQHPLTFFSSKSDSNTQNLIQVYTCVSLKIWIYIDVHNY